MHWFTISRLSGNSIYCTHETIFIQNILSIVQSYYQGKEYWHLRLPLKLYVLASGMLSWYCLRAMVKLYRTLYSVYSLQHLLWCLQRTKVIQITPLISSSSYSLFRSYTERSIILKFFF